MTLRVTLIIRELAERAGMSTYPASVNNIKWRISRACESAGCVGVARQGKFVLVGDTTNSEWPVSSFTVKGWSEFLALAKHGGFDNL